MIRNLFLFVFTGMFLISCGEIENKSYQADLGNFFGDFSGAFVLYDYNNKFYIRHNEEQCKKRYSPCSTFKIPNSLIGLETGVIDDENFVIQWDSVKREREELNKDHNLQSAIKNSVVWYYQELARKVGEDKMKYYVDTMGYGNMNISGGIDRFWLGSSLEISAEEQVQFLYKLYTDSLPFSKNNMEIVRNIIIQDTLKTGAVFSGKTGSNGSDLGWFVGTVQLGSNLYIFATNIVGAGANGMKARDITLDIIKTLKIL